MDNFLSSECSVYCCAVPKHHQSPRRFIFLQPNLAFSKRVSEYPSEGE
jgi:hypothetical protein